MNPEKLLRGPALDEEIRDYIKKYILDSKLGPGEALPPEIQWAQELGVGRGTIREAIKALESLGIVEVRRGDGMYVREYNLDPLLENLSFGMRFQTATLVELAQIRTWLETEIVEQAVRQAQPEDIAQLERIIDAWREAVGAGAPALDLVAELDMSFHRALYRPLDNQMLNRFLEAFWVIFFTFLGDSIEPAYDLDDHARILEAARLGDPIAARQTLLRNLLHMQARIRRSLELGRIPVKEVLAPRDDMQKIYRRPALSEAIRDYLKQYILDQGLGAGDALPTEAQLAQDLGVARTSVREAIKALESLGIVEVRHGEGLYVREYNFDPVLETLSYGIRFDARTLLELLQLRSWLEGAVIVEAVDRMSADDIRRLEDIIRRWSRAIQTGESTVELARELDEGFHRSLYTCLKNNMLMKLIEVFWVAFAEFIGPYRAEPSIDLAEHVAILEAVKAKDRLRARQAVLANIRRNEERMQRLAESGRY